MSIPTYDALMLPVLRLCAEKVWLMRDLTARLADDLQLGQLERDQMIPSGSLTVLASRAHWAKTYLKQAGLLEQPKRAQVQITARGREVLSRNPTKIDGALLRGFEEFRAFLGRTKSEDTSLTQTASMSVATGAVAAPVAIDPAEIASTPEERIATASLALDEALRDALLTRVLECDPAFFEKMIVDLLLAMGYGGSRPDAGEQLGRTGDEGVDGVIREDRLGLDRVYLQAKRYQPGSKVGPEAVQAFMGALVGRGAQKGVLMTTSTFTPAARRAADQSGHLRLVLIDGNELTRLMVSFGVGVQVERTIAIKRINRAYFEAADPE